MQNIDVNKKPYCHKNNIIENNEISKVSIKNHTCYLNDIIKLENSDFDILLYERSCENILVCDS